MITISELMTSDLVTVEPEMTLREAAESLRAAGVSGAPVTAAGRLLGVISASDILEFQATNPGIPTYRESQVEEGRWGPAERWEENQTEPLAAYFADMWVNSGMDVANRVLQTEGPEWDVLEEHVVGEVMTRKVVALPLETDVAQAAREMVDREIHRVLVADGERLRGIFTAMDLVRAVADLRLHD